MNRVINNKTDAIGPVQGSTTNILVFDVSNGVLSTGCPQETVGEK